MSMTLPRILKAFAVTADGRGLVGKGENAKLPDLNLQTEEIRTGGLDAPVEQDMGQEKLEFTFALKEYDPSAIGLWGRKGVDSTQLTFKGHAESATGEEMQVIAQMRGQVKQVSGSEIKAGQANDLTFTASLVYYKLQVDGEEPVEIDVLNGKRIVNGEDVLAGQRANLGI